MSGQEMSLNGMYDVYVALVICATICIVVIVVALVFLLWHRRELKSKMDMEIKRREWSVADRDAVKLANMEAKKYKYVENVIKNNEKMIDEIVVLVKERYKDMDKNELMAEKNNLQKEYEEIIKKYASSVAVNREN